MVDTVTLSQASSATNIILQAGGGQGVLIEASAAVVSGEDGGDISIPAGSGLGSGNGGQGVVGGGDGGETGNAGNATLNAGNGGSTSGNGGNAKAFAGDATEGNGGNVMLRAGLGGGAGVNGNLLVYNLPTIDPGIADPTLVGNAVWLNGGVLTISAGA